MSAVLFDSDVGKRLNLACIHGGYRGCICCVIMVISSVSVA